MSKGIFGMFAGRKPYASAANEDFTALLVKRLEKYPGELRLNEREIQDSQVPTLVEFLKKNPAVTKIDLTNNQIGDEGAETLAGFLVGKHTVTNVNLSNNQIGDRGATALAEVLRRSQVVAAMDVSFNRIKAAGFQSLADGLRGGRATSLAYAGFQGHYSEWNQDANLGSNGEIQRLLANNRAAAAVSAAEATGSSEPQTTKQQSGTSSSSFPSSSSSSSEAASPASAVSDAAYATAASPTSSQEEQVRSQQADLERQVKEEYQAEKQREETAKQREVAKERDAKAQARVNKEVKVVRRMDNREENFAATSSFSIDPKSPTFRHPAMFDKGVKPTADDRIAILIRMEEVMSARVAARRERVEAFERKHNRPTTMKDDLGTIYDSPYQILGIPESGDRGLYGDTYKGLLVVLHPRYYMSDPELKPFEERATALFKILPELKDAFQKRVLQATIPSEAPTPIGDAAEHLASNSAAQGQASSQASR